MIPVRRHALLAVCLLLSVLVAGQATAATAVPDPSKFKIRTRIAKLEVRTSGQMTILRLKDTTSDCFPGVHYLQQNRFTFGSGGWLPVRINNLSAPGLDSVITSPFSRAGGTARTAGQILDYRETNYCKGEQQKLPPKPECRSSNGGRISVSLQVHDPPSSGDPDLTSLEGHHLMIAIQRKGGSPDPTGCIGGGPGNISGHPDADTAVATTSIAPTVSEILPTGIQSIKVFSMRREQRLRRHITVQGTCDNATVRVTTSGTGSPPIAQPPADGDCTFAGYVDVGIRTIQKK